MYSFGGATNSNSPSRLCIVRIIKLLYLSGSVSTCSLVKAVLIDSGVALPSGTSASTAAFNIYKRHSHTYRILCHAQTASENLENPIVGTE